MQISHTFRALKRRWYATVLVVVAAVAVAVMLDKKAATVPTGTATVQILVDSPVSALVNLQSDPTGLEARASVLAQAMTSNAVLAEIAKSAGVPPQDVTAQGPYSGAGEVLDVATPSEARGMQIVSIKPQYRLTFVAQQDIPIVTVSVVAPNADAAGKFANAVVPGTDAWLDSLASADQVKSGKLVHLRQLGDAQAGTVNSSSAKIVAIVGAVAILMLGFLLISLTDKERRARRRQERERAERELAESLEYDRTHPGGPVYAPVPVVYNGTPAYPSHAEAPVYGPYPHAAPQPAPYDDRRAVNGGYDESYGGSHTNGNGAHPAPRHPAPSHHENGTQETSPRHTAFHDSSSNGSLVLDFPAPLGAEDRFDNGPAPSSNGHSLELHSSARSSANGWRGIGARLGRSSRSR